MATRLDTILSHSHSHGEASTGEVLDEKEDETSTSTSTDIESQERFFPSATNTSEKEQPVSWLERIDHVTWANFACSLSTGGIALLLSNQEHTFDGLLTIGKIVFIFEICMFLTLVTLISIRFTRSPWKLRKSLTHPTESLLFPTFLLSMATMVGNMAVYGIPSTGPWLAATVRVLFWIYTALAFILATFQYYQLFLGQNLTIPNMTPGWLLPVFPAMLVGFLAGIIASTQTPSQRIPILVGGLTFQGLGFWSAISIYAIYMGRLMQQGLPDLHARPAMFIAAGPPSFTIVAIINMSNAIPEDWEYFIRHPTAKEALSQVALAFSVFIWCLAFWMFAIALLSCVSAIPKMRFRLAWWAMIFPNIGFVVATIKIGVELSSPAVTWVGSIMTILMVATYLFILGSEVRALYKSNIWYPGKDEDKN